MYTKHSAWLHGQAYILKTRYFNCLTKTKPWHAKIADKNLYSPQANKTSSLKKDSLMNPHVVRIAATPAKMPGDLSVKCLTLSALPVEKPAKFLSSPGMTVRFTVANAFRSKDNWRMLIAKVRLERRTFLLIFLFLRSHYIFIFPCYNKDNKLRRCSIEYEAKSNVEE